MGNNVSPCSCCDKRHEGYERIPGDTHICPSDGTDADRPPTEGREARQPGVGEEAAHLSKQGKVYDKNPEEREIQQKPVQVSKERNRSPRDRENGRELEHEEAIQMPEDSDNDKENQQERSQAKDKEEEEAKTPTRQKRQEEDEETDCEENQGDRKEEEAAHEENPGDRERKEKEEEKSDCEENPGDQKGEEADRKENPGDPQKEEEKSDREENPGDRGEDKEADCEENLGNREGKEEEEKSYREENPVDQKEEEEADREENPGDQKGEEEEKSNCQENPGDLKEEEQQEKSDLEENPGDHREEADRKENPGDQKEEEKSNREENPGDQKEEESDCEENPGDGEGKEEEEEKSYREENPGDQKAEEDADHEENSGDREEQTTEEIKLTAEEEKHAEKKQQNRGQQNENEHGEEVLEQAESRYDKDGEQREENVDVAEERRSDTGETQEEREQEVDNLEVNEKSSALERNLCKSELEKDSEEKFSLLFDSELRKDNVEQLNLPAPHSLVEVPEASPTREVHIETLQALHIFNVDVVVKRQTSDENEDQQVSSEPSVPQPQLEESSPGATEERNEQNNTAPTSVQAQHLHIGQCNHVTMQATSSTICVNLEEAELQRITDSNIKLAVENALFAKVNWTGKQELKYKKKYEKEKKTGQKFTEWCEGEIRKMEEELQEEKNEGERKLNEAKREGQEKVKAITEKLMSRLTTSEVTRAESERERENLMVQLWTEQAAAEEKVARLTEHVDKKQKENENELAAMKQHYECEKKKEEEKVMTFVLRLEERDQQVLRNVAAELEGEQLADVVKRLYSDLNIRLLGVDCGLSFLMEAPVSQWTAVIEKQIQIQTALSELLPDDVREEAIWHDVTQFSQSDENVDITLGHPLPSQVELDAQSNKHVEVDGDSVSDRTETETDSDVVDFPWAIEDDFADSVGLETSTLSDETLDQTNHDLTRNDATEQGYVPEYMPYPLETPALSDSDQVLSDTPEDKYKYDVFVAYHSSTEEIRWVSEVLLHELENENGMRLFLHDRDEIVGSYVYEAMVESMESSKALLFIFSEDFARSPECMFQLQVGLKNAVEMNIPLVIIRYDDSPAELFGSSGRTAMRMYPCFSWNQTNSLSRPFDDKTERFWTNVKRALVSPQKNPAKTSFGASVWGKLKTAVLKFGGREPTVNK